MKPPNLHYVNCCGTCRFSEVNYEGTIYCTKYKKWFDVELICDAFELICDAFEE